MLEYTDECCGCEPSMGCLGSSCPNRNVPHFICDECKEEYDPEELLDVEGDWLCKDCLFERMKKEYRKVSDIL